MFLIRKSPAKRTFRRRRAWAVLAACLWFCAQVAAAQQPAALPPSVVLVLELISRTHVKPTTGVVIREDGLVLVPADFVSAGAEIVVLDGGTDIARYGRPAKTIRRSADDGLAVLEVEGLARQPVALNSDGRAAGERLGFAAFPPAEQLAEGVEPLNLQLVLGSSETGDGPLIAPDKALPNVAGPLFNSCGQLAGFNLSAGTPSLEGGGPSRTLLAPELHDLLSAMDLGLIAKPCGEPPSAGEAPDQAIDLETRQQAGEPRDAGSQGAGSQDLQTAAGQPEADESEIQHAAPGPENTDPGMDSPSPGKEGTLDGRQMGQPGAEPPDALTSYLVATVLSVILIGLYYRIKSRRASPGAAMPSPHSEESDTGRIPPFPAEDDSRPGFKYFGLEFVEGAPALPEGCATMVLIEGKDQEGREFSRYSAVKQSSFNLIAGSDEAADLSLAGSGVARHHVRIEGESGAAGWAIRVGNLAGREETRVNNVPCLEGEAWYIEPGDEVMLGEVRFRLRLHGQPGERA